MRMTPDDFFEIFVKGNYEDYQLNVGCIRQAFNAAVSASHLADQYFWYYKKYDQAKVKPFEKLIDFRKYLSENTNDCFRDIWSISNAYKHLYVSDLVSTITSPGAIESISFLDKKSEIKKIQEDWTVASNSSKVVFTRKNGQQSDFLPTLETVIKFWEELLYKGDPQK